MTDFFNEEALLEASSDQLALEPDDEGSEIAHDARWTIYGDFNFEHTTRRFQLVFSTAENHPKNRSRKHFSHFSQDTHELFPDFSLIFSGLFPDFFSRFFFFSKFPNFFPMNFTIEKPILGRKLGNQ